MNLNIFELLPNFITRKFDYKVGWLPMNAIARTVDHHSVVLVIRNINMLITGCFFNKRISKESIYLLNKRGISIRNGANQHPSLLERVIRPTELLPVDTVVPHIYSPVGGYSRNAPKQKCSSAVPESNSVQYSLLLVYCEVGSCLTTKKVLELGLLFSISP